MVSIEEKIIYDKLVKYSKYEIKDSREIDSIKNARLQECIQNIEVNVMKNNQMVTSYRFLEMSSGIFGKMKWFLKKVVRRLNFFYVQPICEQQTEFNTAATEGIEGLLAGEISLNAELEKCIKEIEKLKKKVKYLESKVTDAEPEENKGAEEL